MVEEYCPPSSCSDFERILAEDPGLACDLLFRHYRGEKWRERAEPMPPIDRRIEALGVVPLPEPRLPPIGLGDVIGRRRSVRDFSGAPMTAEELSALLFYSAGVTGWDGGWPLRATPSAGGLQPVEAYVYADRVRGLERGIYRYDFIRHRLDVLKFGNYSRTLASIALDQEHVAKAAAVFALTVYYRRTYWKYWKRALRYALLDAGAVMEHLYLAAAALGLGACAVGAFYDEELCRLLGLDCHGEFPVMLVAVGRPI